MSKETLPKGFRPLENAVGIRAVGWFIPDTDTDQLTWAIEWAPRVQSPHRLGRLEIILKDGTRWAYKDVPTQHALGLYNTQKDGVPLSGDAYLHDNIVPHYETVDPWYIEHPSAIGIADLHFELHRLLTDLQSYAIRAWKWIVKLFKN